MKKYIALIDTFNQARMDLPSEEVLRYYRDIPEITETDNRGFQITRPLFSHSSVPDELGFESIEISNDLFTEENELFYFLHVHHNQSLWVNNIQVLPNYIIHRIQKGEVKLVFDNTLEGNRIDGEFFLDDYYRKLNELDLPLENVYYISNNILSEDTHKEWLKDKKILQETNIISFMWNVHDVKRLIYIDALPPKIDFDELFKYQLDNVGKIKHFLKINRTNRNERNLFMLFMNKFDLLKKSLVSFPDFPTEHYNPDFSFITDEENVKDLQSKCPFYIDNRDSLNIGPAGQGEGFFDADLPFNPVHYRNTFMSIVMCAFPYEENACHLHSSTYNPIYCGHPFIHFGPIGSLQELRNRGFKTFGDWWDESYDNEKDHDKRLRMVMDLTKKLSNKTQVEMLKMRIEMRDVLQHNYSLIRDYTIEEYLLKKIVS
jgi:hypothetical protein